MREADGLARELDDLRLDSRRQCRRRLWARRTPDELERRLGKGGDGEERRPGFRREPFEPLADKCAEARRQRLARFEPDRPTLDGTGEFERKEWIPARDLVQTTELRAGEHETEPSRSRRWRAPRLSGPRINRRKRSSGNARSSPSGTRSPSASVRRVRRKTTRSSRRRRSANSSTKADGPSSHWTSSTAITSGPACARIRTPPRKATDTARWSGGCPSASSSSRATSSARRWGAGSVGSVSASVGSSRSARAAKESRVSAVLGVAREFCSRAKAPPRDRLSRGSSSRCRLALHEEGGRGPVE